MTTRTRAETPLVTVTVTVAVAVVEPAFSLRRAPIRAALYEGGATPTVTVTRIHPP